MVAIIYLHLQRWRMSFATSLSRCSRSRCYDFGILFAEIALDDSNDVERADKMSIRVHRMIDLHRNIVEAKTPEERGSVQRQIEATDRKIDQLVYELYDLTDDEIAIVECETE